MATPPLPDVPTVRVRLIYTDSTGQLSGSRFYLSYAGSAPAPADCITLATDIAGVWAAHIAALVNDDISLTEVDVIDIATTMGASGQWTGTDPGTRAGTPLPIQCANNVEFDIAPRYRGGKPRMYFPPPVTADLGGLGNFSSAFLAASNAAVLAFFNAVTALSVGTMGALAHILLSYYHGVNTASPPWRGPGYKYPPKYRATALHIAVEGYATKSVIGSQKRRRTSTTP